MIHYHGSPLSGSNDQAVRFFAGRHAFVSFFEPRQLPLIASVCQSFALDNGAFSHWKRGGILDCAGYYDWCAQWLHHPACDWAIIPDVIDGDEAANDELCDAWPHGKSQGVPVWHYHESLDRLDRLVSDWPRVALGSSGQWPTPGNRDWWDRTTAAMRVACDDSGSPRCKLHGLRMLAPKIVRRLPLASADSTNAARNCQHDQKWKPPYRPQSRWLRAVVIAEAVESQQSAATYRRRKSQTVMT